MGMVPDAWYDSLLAKLQATVNRTVALSFFHAWQRAEGGTATNNPFDTTEPMPGATPYNTLAGGGHVWNYPDQETGVLATFYTMIGGSGNAGNPRSWGDPRTNPSYFALMQSLGAGGLDATSDPQNLAVDVGNSPWGSNASLISQILSGQGFTATNQPAQVGGDEGATHPASLTDINSTDSGPGFNDLVGVAKESFSWTKALGKILSDLLYPRFWLRVGQGLASVVLLLIGMGLVFRRDAMAAAKIGALA